MANYYAPFSLRVPEETVEKMKRIAATNHRSANKEMEVALEQYIAAYEQQLGPIQL
ncbi:MAG: Arc family DNA-binding protein [Oscillibacter sp.]